MKVLLVNGSPNKNKCTNRALIEIANTLKEENIESEIFWIGRKPISGCTDCHVCEREGKCILKDEVVEKFLTLARESDGFVFGSPVHYASASGSMTSFMDRAFISELVGNDNKAFYLKPASVIVSARRAGTTATFDQLNKYLTLHEMFVVSSSYWNMVHGDTIEEVERDLEGLQTMRVLARNMAYFLRCKEIANKYNVALPKREEPVFTNFIQ